MALLHDKCDKCHNFRGVPKDLYLEHTVIKATTTRNFSRVCKQRVEERVREEDKGALIEYYAEKKDLYRCIACGRTQKTPWIKDRPEGSWEEWKDDSCE